MVILTLLAIFLLSALIVWTLNRLELREWQRSAGGHWTERARALQSARGSRRSHLWALPGCFALLDAMLGLPPHWIPAVLVSFAGTLLGGFPMDRATLPDVTFPRWLRWVAIETVLLYAEWIALGIAAWYAPTEANPRFAALLGLCILLHLALVFGWHRRLLQVLGLIRPATPELQRLVGEIAVRLGVRVRALWESDYPVANAAAFIYSGEIVFTRRLVTLCTAAELQAIAAHEIGHLTESKRIKTVHLLGSFAFFPVLGIRLFNRMEPGIGWVIALLMSLVALLGTQRLRRTMEKRADRVARESVENPADYARALEKMHEADHRPAVTRQPTQGSHPDLYDRMLAAGVTPGYPRPRAAPAEGWSGIGVRLTLAVFVALALLGLPFHGVVAAVRDVFEGLVIR